MFSTGLECKHTLSGVSGTQKRQVSFSSVEGEVRGSSRHGKGKKKKRNGNFARYTVASHVFRNCVLIWEMPIMSYQVGKVTCNICNLMVVVL